MSVTRFIEALFRRFVPSPFAIAVCLTFLVSVLGFAFGRFPEGTGRVEGVLAAWEQGLWNRDLLVFAYQMMLILVLGHILVLSRPVARVIDRITGLARDPASAAALVAVSTVLVSFFNWGLGLIFGAILARKMGEHAQRTGMPVNYPLIGACGYLGLMVWHGGISGSAPLKASEPGHLHSLLAGVLPEAALTALPETVDTAQTLFSAENLLIFGCVVAVVAGLAYRLGRIPGKPLPELPVFKYAEPGGAAADGAERADRSPWIAGFLALLIAGAFTVQYLPQVRTLNLSPDLLNLFMLGLALILHRNLRNFSRALEAAIGDTAGILIQFPLYFGIMGIMTQTGLIHRISDFFIAVSNPETFPILTFFSAGLVNLAVPSGGGQWAVQGPIILDAALNLGVPLPKAVMALAYGDQLTNMLQPFWALPLLGITRLKARDILPYSLIFMVAAGFVYLIGIWLW